MRSAYWATVQRAPKDPFDSEQDQRAKLMTYLTVHWFMQTLVQRQEAMPLPLYGELQGMPGK